MVLWETENRRIAHLKLQRSEVWNKYFECIVWGKQIINAIAIHAAITLCRQYLIDATERNE